MDLSLTLSDKEFVAAAQQFLAMNWRAADALVTGRRGAVIRARYIAALTDSGRLVGHWPAAQGGLGWTPRERWLWEHEAAAAQAPQPPVTGPDLLADLLLRHGTAAQQARHLPGIAEGLVSWCQALAEDSGGLDLDQIETCATPLHPRSEPASTGSGWTLSGTKPWVLDLPALPLEDQTDALASREYWACVLARVPDTADLPDGDPAGGGFGLFLVDLSSAGVSIAQRRMVGENPGPGFTGHYLVGSLVFAGVELPDGALVGSIDATGELALTLEQAEFAHPGAVARNSVLLAQLREFVAGGELDGGSLWGDEDYRARLHELEVSNAGLVALQARAVAAQSITAPDEGAAIAGANLLLATGCRGLSQQLAQLQVEALGYFALPYADIEALDNEGPIGPEFSRPVLFGMLSARAREAVLAPREHLKNIIAKSVLGLSSAGDSG